MMKNRKPDGCREVLKLKIAIVTGASSGMGREFALQIPQLYKNLDELWVVARRTDRLKSLQEQVKIPVRIFDGDMQRDYIFEKESKVIANKFKKILPALNEVNQLYFENKKLSYYADLCSISQSNFRKLFKEYTGQSFIDYRNTIRVHEAKKLIDNEVMTKTEAAYLCGFNNMSFFYKVYNKFNGCI